MTIVQNLPVEILGEIFLHSLPITPDLSQPDPTIPPILLCHICSSWRSAALRFPKLWSCLRLHSTFKVLYPVYIRVNGPERGILKHPESYKDLQIHPRTLEFLAWWKNNAASIPIDLYVAKIKEEIVNYFVNEDDVVIGNIRPDPTIVKALDFALDALPAVRHFEMAINRDAMEVLCKAATSSTFERLESLVVEQYFHIGIRVKEKFLFAFPPAPRLRRVALDRYNCTPSFFWSQLTHLCVSSEITEDDWLEVLKNCANLVCGAFKIGPDDEPAKSERLIHTNLCQLILAPICFRSVVSFPALKALRLLRNETDHTLMALTELLMATPVLRELHFDSEIFNPAIFSFDSAIETTDGLREILPDLDHLVFDATRCSTDSGGDTVVRLLRSGWMELAPHSGARGHLLIIFDPEYQSMNSPITPEEFDVIRKSEVARALEEFQSGQERSYDVQLCYPSVGGRRRDCQPNLENLPNWDEFMGFHDKVSLPMQ